MRCFDQFVFPVNVPSRPRRDTVGCKDCRSTSQGVHVSGLCGSGNRCRLMFLGEIVFNITAAVASTDNE